MSPSGLALLKSLWQDLSDFAFPGYCYLCNQHLGSPDRFVCASCLENLPVLPDPFCPLCRKREAEMQNGHTCQTNLRSVYSLWPYDDKAGVLIRKFKYENRMSLGVKLSRRLAQELKRLSFFSCIDLVLPVPLHGSRKRERGFNQSEIIARTIAETHNSILMAPALKRWKNTLDQTHLSASERRQNVRGAFCLAGDQNLRSKKVLLVDDVVTTGATLSECAGTLRSGQVDEVYACTLAVAV